MLGPKLVVGTVGRPFLTMLSAALPCSPPSLPLNRSPRRTGRSGHCPCVLHSRRSRSDQGIQPRADRTPLPARQPRMHRRGVGPGAVGGLDGAARPGRTEPSRAIPQSPQLQGSQDCLGWNGLPTVPIHLPPRLPPPAQLSEQDRARLVDRAVGAISEWLDRFDVVVVGPGLGRDDLVLETAAKVRGASDWPRGLTAPVPIEEVGGALA